MTAKFPALGKEDFDWTEPFLERGTTFTAKGNGIILENVPVEKCWIKDETLYVEGTVTF